MDRLRGASAGQGHPDRIASRGQVTECNDGPAGVGQVSNLPLETLAGYKPAPRQIAKNASASANDSGVPMSMKRPSQRCPYSSPRFTQAGNTSRSSENDETAGRELSSGREIEYTPALIQPGRAAGSFSANRTTRPASSRVTAPYRPASGTCASSMSAG